MKTIPYINPLQIELGYCNLVPICIKNPSYALRGGGNFSSQTVPFIALKISVIRFSVFFECIIHIPPLSLSSIHFQLSESFLCVFLEVSHSVYNFIHLQPYHRLKKAESQSTQFLNSVNETIRVIFLIF